VIFKSIDVVAEILVLNSYCFADNFSFECFEMKLTSSRFQAVGEISVIKCNICANCIINLL
jgi:hypothetical protein